jgi:transposase-like protein
MPTRYPPEFRRQVLELVKTGRSVGEVAAALGVSDQTVYTWRNQELIDSGRKPGVSSSDHAELVEAGKKIARLEADLAASARAVELLKEAVPPKAGGRRPR